MYEHFTFGPILKHFDPMFPQQAFEKYNYWKTAGNVSIIHPKFKTILKNNPLFRIF
jgi:hypothetical protein